MARAFIAAKPAALAAAGRIWRRVSGLHRDLRSGGERALPRRRRAARSSLEPRLSRGRCDADRGRRAWPASPAGERCPACASSRTLRPRSIRSAWPVGSIWAAHQRRDVEPVGHSRAETVLVVRPEAEVNVHILPAQDAAFAEALLAGATLGEAAERASAGRCSIRLRHRAGRAGRARRLRRDQLSRTGDGA